jgi:hypothetical protein
MSSGLTISTARSGPPHQCVSRFFGDPSGKVHGCVGATIVRFAAFLAVAELRAWEHNSLVTANEFSAHVDQRADKVLMLDIRQRRHRVRDLPNLVPAIASGGSAVLAQFAGEPAIHYDSSHVRNSD